MTARHLQYPSVAGRVSSKPPVSTKAKDRPESQRRYRYRVEIRDLRDGSVHTLPLHVLTLIHLGGKKGDPPKPDEQVLRLEDAAAVFEAKDLDALAAQLKLRYPDESHERRLHWERDLEAEQRYEAAMKSLIELLAKAVMDEVLQEQAADQKDLSET